MGPLSYKWQEIQLIVAETVNLLNHVDERGAFGFGRWLDTEIQIGIHLSILGLFSGIGFPPQVGGPPAAPGYLLSVYQPQ